MVACLHQRARAVTTNILHLLLSDQKRFRTSMASASDPLSPDPPCSRKRAAAVSLVGASETPDKTPRRAQPEEDHWTRIQPKLKAPQPPSSDVITFPRTAVGLNTLHQAIARDFPEAVRTSRGHWECNTQHTATRLTSIVGKDQYESPWSVVSVLKEKEGIDFDACATPFSAVSPNASVEFIHCHQIIQWLHDHVLRPTS